MKRWWDWTLEVAVRCVQPRIQRTNKHHCVAEVQYDWAESSVSDLFIQVDRWMQPRILKTLPVYIQEWVKLRTQEGEQDPTHFLMFYAQDNLTHDQGQVQDTKDWKELIHGVVNTTSRGELS